MLFASSPGKLNSLSNIVKSFSTNIRRNIAGDQCAIIHMKSGIFSEAVSKLIDRLFIIRGAENLWISRYLWKSQNKPREILIVIQEQVL